LSLGQDGIRRLKMSVCAVVKVIGMEVFEGMPELFQLSLILSRCHC